MPHDRITPDDVVRKIRDVMRGKETRVITGRSLNQPVTDGSGGAPVQGFTNPMSALGDLIKGGAAGALRRLGIGSPGQVLTVVGGEPAWAAIPDQHVPVTVTDTSSIDLTLAGQQVSAAAIFGTTAGTVAEGNHTHAAAYQPLDADLTAIAALTPNDGDVITWDSTPGEWVAAPSGSSYTDEQARDALGAALVAGNNLDITVNDGADTITIDVESLTSADLTDFAEAVDDRVGALLVEGTGIDLTYDDGANTLTIATTGGAGYTDEQAQDAVGTILTDSASIDFTYDDATPTVTAAVIPEAIQDIVGAMIVAGTNISVAYDDGAGTVTITNTAGGGGASVGNPLQTRRQSQVLKTPGGVTTLTVLGLATQTPEGTLSAADDADGPWVSCTTSTTVNNVAGYRSSGTTEVRRDWLPDITYAIKTDASAITGLCYWVGMFSSGPIQNAVPTTHHAAFRYHTTADGTAFWSCVTDNASGTPTVTVTTSAIAVNTKYVLRVDCSVSGEVRFYVNQTLVATHTTTLPTATQTMGLYARVVNLVGGVGTARAIKFGRLGLLHEP